MKNMINEIESIVVSYTNTNHLLSSQDSEPQGSDFRNEECLNNENEREREEVILNVSTSGLN